LDPHFGHPIHHENGFDLVFDPFHGALLWNGRQILRLWMYSCAASALVRKDQVCLDKPAGNARWRNASNLLEPQPLA
jgi:hypothetical protein